MMNGSGIARSVGAVVLASLATGCAWTATPVLLVQKPNFEEQLAPNGMKVRLEVDDTRHVLIQKARLCGIKRNSFYMRTSVAFIAHWETLDVLVARAMREVLETAGYEVTEVEPHIDGDGSERTLEKPPISDSELDTAGDLNAGEDVEKQDGEEARVQVTRLADAAGAAGVSDDPDVDLVVKVRIVKFNSDLFQAFAFVSIQASCVMDVIVLDATDLDGAPLLAERISGWGTSGPRVLITDECYTIAVNMGYWIAINSAEELFRETLGQVMRGGVAMVP